MVADSMIVSSREMRWFFDSPILKLGSSDRPLDQRADYYAPIWDVTSSVKFRDSDEPLLESKFLVDESSLRLADDRRFTLQRWRKISVRVSPDEIESLRMLTKSNWAKVRKRRQLRYFDIRSGRWHESSGHMNTAGADTAGADTAGADTVQVEWSEVELERYNCRFKPSWTFCIETSDSLDDSLIKSLFVHLQERMNLAWTQLAEPQSYPSWLWTQICRNDPCSKIEQR